MEEEIQLYLNEAKDLMNKAIKHFSSELTKIRAGKAMPNMLDGLIWYCDNCNTQLQVS